MHARCSPGFFVFRPPGGCDAPSQFRLTGDEGVATTKKLSRNNRLLPRWQITPCLNHGVLRNTDHISSGVNPCPPSAGEDLRAQVGSIKSKAQHENVNLPATPARAFAPESAIRTVLLLVLLALWCFALACTVAGAESPATDYGPLTPDSPVLPAWLLSTLTFLGTVKLVMSFAEVRFYHWTCDKLNEIAASELQDDDEYLRDIFSTRQWKLYCFIGRLLSFRLPTLADLDRTIRLQAESVLQADGRILKFLGQSTRTTNNR